MEAVPYVIFLYCVFAFGAFWIIRLAVRYGVDDALRKHRSWLAGRDAAAPTPGRGDRS